MGKNKQNKYRIVEALPVDAMLVSEYARQWPCNTSYLYKLIREKKKTLSFEIVDFHGINFVLPN